MKQKFISLPEGEEFDLLSEQLEERDIFVLSYLKGFNRRNMKEWANEGIGIFGK